MPYPTRSYVRAHPSFQLDDGSETQSPTKRSPSKQSPYKKSQAKGSQRTTAFPNRLKVKVTPFPTLREGSVQPTPRTRDPTTPQTYNPPTSEELARAPRKLRRATNVIGGEDGSWLATRGGVREDVSPLTSFAPGRLSMLPEVGVEDEGIVQGEYVSLTKISEVARTIHERREQREKENHTAAGPTTGSNTDVNQRASSSVRADYPAIVRGIMRTDTEEVFN